MTDVRLTALNPEDSQVYPVACNSSGELKLEKQATFDGNLDGDLTVTGSATFAGDLICGGSNANQGTGSWIQSIGGIYTTRPAGSTAPVFSGYQQGGASNPTAVINADGSASFAGKLQSTTWPSTGYSLENTAQGGSLGLASPAGQSGNVFAIATGGTSVCSITATGSSSFAGSATFAGDVVIGSRSKQWMLVEQGGLCHMVEQVKATTADLVDPAAAEYPKLRDVFQELNTIERCLEEVMTKLRMTEPDGWPVWDGSDNSR